MILTSTGDAVGGTPSAHGTSRPGRGLASGLDWDRVERLYSFARARAFERLHEAEHYGEVVVRREHRQSILAMDAMFAQAQHGDPVVASCAITYFRARAMRDANHPDFLGEWL